jgi:diacylglycerol kinase family enzyme
MIVVAANPFSGAGPNRRRVDALVAALGALGAAPRVVWSAAERAAVFADAAAMRGCRAVIAAGGDGTVAQIVNELPPGLPLAVLPLGNENLVARALRFGREPMALARAVVRCRTRALDLGRATADGRTRLFALMLSVGFDAAVVHRVAAWREADDGLRRIRRWSYVGPIAASALGYAHTALRVSAEALSTEAAHCMIANIPAYPLGIALTPDAAPDDGRLDWVVLERRGMLPLAGYCWAALRGRHLRRRDVRAGQATRLTLTAAAPAPVQLDGDPWGTTPVTVEVVPRALTVIATD